MTDPSLDERVAVLEGELEVRRRFAPFARLYGPMAVVSLALSFLPVLGDAKGEDGLEWTYGTLWQMAGRGSGNPAVLGVLILGSLVVLLVVATVGVRSTKLPVAIAAHAAVLLLMLLAKPGTADPAPPLTDAGVADVAVLTAVVVTAVTHAARMERWKAELSAGAQVRPSGGK